MVLKKIFRTSLLWLHWATNIGTTLLDSFDSRMFYFYCAETPSSSDLNVLKNKYYCCRDAFFKGFPLTRCYHNDLCKKIAAMDSSISKTMIIYITVSKILVSSTNLNFWDDVFWSVFLAYLNLCKINNLDLN